MQTLLMPNSLIGNKYYDEAFPVSQHVQYNDSSIFCFVKLLAHIKGKNIFSAGPYGFWHNNSNIQ